MIVGNNKLKTKFNIRFLKSQNSKNYFETMLNFLLINNFNTIILSI